MKYQFKNIGPIKSAELELGGLTVIAGANNTGKTCIAHSLYVFQRYLLLMSKKSTLLRRAIGIDRNLDVKFSFDRSGAISGSINVAAATNMIKHMVKEAPRWFFRDSFSSKPEVRLLEDASVSLSEMDVIIPAEIDEKQNVDIFGDKNWSLERKEELLLFSFYPSARIKRYLARGAMHMLKRQIREELGRILMGFVLGSSASPFILTAERLGISIFYKDLDFAKNRFVEALQQNIDNRSEGEDEEQFVNRLLLLNKSNSRYSQPIKDNIDYTRGLDDAVKRSSELSQVELFDDIEKMMKGSYQYDDNGVIFIPYTSLMEGEQSSSNVKEIAKIPLHKVSSSVCCLSDIYFYLKHTAKKNQLMIIDEPESHLDTANQVRLARLLAQCVNAGLRVLITTHSDYIVKEFNNLIMLSSDFPKKEKFLKTEEYSNKDFLQKESVRAYVCENYTLSPCAIDSRGMDIALFDSTINNINRVSDKLDNYLPDEK